MNKRRLSQLFCVALVIIGVIWGVAGSTGPISIAKGRVIGNHIMALQGAELLLHNLALNDVTIAAALAGKEYDFLSATRLGRSELDRYGACSADCQHITFYNYTDGGTVEAVYNPTTRQFIAQWQNRTARPNPSGYITRRVVQIANRDKRVTDVLGNLNMAEVAMIPMSTWLLDDDCNEDWCVDLTFFDPKGTGRVFHAIVNLHQEKVARTFYTRSRPIRAQVAPPQLDESALLFSDGCRQEAGWDVCWEMTPHDGVNFYDARYNDELVFTTAKIGQVEAFYRSWPGGYRDEIGYAASVPPKFDTRVTSFADGFEVRQLFTEPFDWPNCTCCYRYEEVIRFYKDGSFSPLFVSHGPGCDDLAEYRPFWRINFALNGESADQVWQWTETRWQLTTSELELELYDQLGIEGERIAIVDGSRSYRFRPITYDPLGLDDGKLFVVNNSDNDEAILVGPADTYAPPRMLADGESLQGEESDLVVWYIPILKTKKSEPYWCMPDPEPFVSPCSAELQIERGGALRQPSEEEIVAWQTHPTPTPIPTVTSNPNTAPTRAATPRSIRGQSAEEIFLNGGCGACHALGSLGEAGKVGPDLSNIGNVAGERVPGQSAETYLYNAIIYPNLFLAADCPNGACLPNIMPSTYHLTLNDEQIKTLISYLLTQKRTEIGAEEGATESEQGGSQQPSAEPTPLWQWALLGAGIGLLGIALLIWRLRKPIKEDEVADHE